jgi:predicted acyltransferase
MWGQVFPLNKKIWTSSYVVYTTGLAILVLSVLIYLIEFKELNKLKGIGLNSGRKLVWLLIPISIYILLSAAAGMTPENNKWLLYLLLALPVFIFFSSLITGNYFLRFFDVFGKNPLFIFVLAGFLPRMVTLIRIPNGVNKDGCAVYLNPLTWFGEKICLPAFDNLKTGSFMYSLALMMLYWAIAWWMDKKKIYVKV